MTVYVGRPGWRAKERAEQYAYRASLEPTFFKMEHALTEFIAARQARTFAEQNRDLHD